MVKGFQSAITIKEAMDKIDENKFVLPGIQRRFVWQPEQIELLFDSLMRGYPMNSLMLWEITDPKIKYEYNYYSFLRKYQQRFAVENELIQKTASDSDFFAVIDGQQRLNSLYIGLKGSYTVKKPHRQWINKSDHFDEKFLYLDLSSKFERESDIDKAYDFRFLTQNEVNESDKYWFKVGDILNFNINSALFRFLEEQEKILDTDYAWEILDKLNDIIKKERILNYYQEDEQDLDKILDIFIRTNDGGTKLTFSDLLMSVLTSHWKESRDEFDGLIKDIRNFGDFNISSDLIIKSILVIYSSDIKNRVKNFDQELLRKVIKDWDRIKIVISNVFQMFYKMGFNSQTFPALNAAIPIIYFVYKHEMEEEIIKARFIGTQNHKLIKKWLILAFLKRIFGGQADTVLLELRKIINEQNDGEFPLQSIIDKAKSHPTKNYNFDSEFIDDLFERTYGGDVFFVLSLFYPELDYYNQNFHVDHLHPQTLFKQKNSEYGEMISRVSNNWNKLGNLQLLNSELNTAKNDKLLKLWVEENEVPRQQLFISNETSLEFPDFEDFYNDRVSCMKVKLKTLLE
ncbi:DUF262 domain-containing protein [Streptococcus suis]|uniref:DUF262 domain-containing protein n=1 Tax=Streptococcus suis TaxID=1307 RepID=UPI0015836CFD|nr:DUF262 domain-containing protein [Streptococcus suis]